MGKMFMGNFGKDNIKEVVEHLEVENILPDTMGSYKPAKMLWGNFGTFAFDVYEGFQNMIATLAVEGDIAHAYTSVDYAILISCSGECRVN